MQRIACSWLVWEWTGSAFWVGVMAAADLLPVVVIGPFAGVAADRWDRLRQNMVAQILSALLAVGLAILVAFDALTLPILLLFVALQGVTSAAVQPARLAMVQQMVAREDMGVAVALNSVNVNLARLTGPALAGAMIAHSDTVWIFILNAAVTFIFVLIIRGIRLAPRDSIPVDVSFLRLMREGFAYVVRTPAIRLMMFTLLMGGVVARSVLELVPVVAASTFRDTSTGLAVLTGAAAVGAVTAALTVSNGASRRLIESVLLWWATASLASILLVYAPQAAVAVTAAVVIGAATTRALIGTQTYVQLATSDELRGRTLSIHGLIARASPAVGALIVGYAADQIGLSSAVTVASSLLIVCLATVFVIFRAKHPES